MFGNNLMSGVLNNDVLMVKSCLNEMRGIDGIALDALKCSTLKKANQGVFDIILSQYIKQCKKDVQSREDLKISKIQRIMNELHSFWGNHSEDTDFGRVELFFKKCTTLQNHWVLQYAAILSFAYAPKYFVKFKNRLSKYEIHFVSRLLLSLVLTEDRRTIPNEAKTLENMALLAEGIPGNINFTDLIILHKKMSPIIDPSEKNKRLDLINEFLENNQKKYLSTNGIPYILPQKIITPEDVENHYNFWQGFNIENPEKILLGVSTEALDKFTMLGFKEFENKNFLNKLDDCSPNVVEWVFQHQNTSPKNQIQLLIAHKNHKNAAKFMEIVVSAIENGGNINEKNYRNETILISAGHKKHQKLFHWLLDHGADANIITKDGDSAAIKFPNYISNYQNKKLKKELRSLKKNKTEKQTRKM